jgi:hypothetical protein
MSGTLEFLCPRASDYEVAQSSVQFFVGIKTFTKTRLRWDVMYSFEDLLGRFVTLDSLPSMFGAMCEVCSNESRSRVILDESVETLNNRTSWALSISLFPFLLN